MADIRQSSSPGTKVSFDANSVAGDLWMRQNYHEIHLELDSEDAKAFVESAEGAGLIIERPQRTVPSSATEQAH
jgi:hypothetical protein